MVSEPQTFFKAASISAQVKPQSPDTSWSSDRFLAILNPLPMSVKESGKIPVMKARVIPLVRPSNDFTVDQNDLKVCSTAVPSQVVVLYGFR